MNLKQRLQLRRTKIIAKGLLYFFMYVMLGFDLGMITALVIIFFMI